MDIRTDRLAKPIHGQVTKCDASHRTLPWFVLLTACGVGVHSLEAVLERSLHLFRTTARTLCTSNYNVHNPLKQSSNLLLEDTQRTENKDVKGGCVLLCSNCHVVCVQVHCEVSSTLCHVKRNSQVDQTVWSRILE